MIFHLTVIIVLLAYQIHTELRKEESFVIDFSKQEEIERIEKEKEEELERLEEELALKEAVLKNLEAKIAASQSNAPARNIAVNTGAPLKDDRGTDAQKLYEDAARLAKDLKTGHQIEEDDDSYANTSSSAKEEKKGEAYNGPSILSWELKGRASRYLPTPAYMCYGHGEVTIIIQVDRSGKVRKAEVGASTTDDRCIHNYAINAALRSRFSASKTAPDPQVGQIVYQFIAQ